VVAISESKRRKLNINNVTIKTKVKAPQLIKERSLI